MMLAIVIYAGLIAAGLVTIAFKRCQPSELDCYIIDYLEREVDWDLVGEMVAHEIIWGVPIGPTLSMVHPPKLRGILDTTGWCLTR